MKIEHNEELNQFKVDDVLGHVVNRAAIIIRKRLSASFKEAGFQITTEEFAIISRLWEEDGLLQTEIIEKTLKDKTRVTRLLGGLIEKSFVEKRTVAEDRRNLRIYLTQEGHALKYKLIPLVNDMMEAASRNISKEDMDTSIRTLRMIYHNINDSVSEGNEK